MVKPIFIVRYPSRYLCKRSLEESRQTIRKVKQALESELPHYNVLLFITDAMEYSFEACYPQDFDEINLEKLQKMAMECLSEIGNEDD